MTSPGPQIFPDARLESALDAVSTFISDTDFDSLPVAVVARISLILADCIAAIAAGNQQPDVRALAGRSIGTTGATIIGTPHKTDVRSAALINGTASSTLEIDEGNRFARGHPGSHVVPAGLATAEAHDSDGRDFLAALVVGYEVGARVGAASRLRDNMQSHGTWGAIAAAVTVGKLRGFTRQQIRTVIDVASCLGLGSNIHAAFEGGSVRNVYAGVGNAMGILAADLVESGYTGGRSSLGIVYGTILSDAFDPTALTNGLGNRWEIERNYFKIHACCRHLHGVADNVLRLRAAHPDLAARVQDIAAIQVESYSKAAEMIEVNPVNMTAAKFSAPFVVAWTTTGISRRSRTSRQLWPRVALADMRVEGFRCAKGDRL